MSEYMLIGVVVTISCACLIAFFIKANRRELVLFLIRMKKLTVGIETHKSQIQLRETNLNRYSFLKYNLKEALKVQIDIKL